MDIASFTSHPSNEVLKQLALGLLTDEELASLESHLERCPQCRRTRSEANASNSKIESLGQAPPTLDGLTEITDLPETQFFSSPSVPGGGMASDNDGEDYSFLSASQSPDELGRLGPYRVLRVLGSGGMGVVFEAEDPQLMRRVALKVMRPGATVGVAARKRFLREAQTAASIEHDHVVPVYQVGEDRGVPFIAMPLLRGQTLAERLASVCDGMPFEPRDIPAAEDGPPGPFSHKRDGLGGPSSGSAPLPVEELARIGREIALGLAAAHRRGLTHRDIKPANIWLEEETGRVRILDFGLAGTGDGGEQLTQSGSVLGTPAYMAPEQASGGETDARSDLFSLGCVLYHAATGRRPFIGRDALSTLLAVTTSEPPAPRELNPALPAELSDLIVSLLAKNPSRRPQTAREVAERLEGSGFRVQGSGAVGNGAPFGPHAVPAADTAALPLPPGEGRDECASNQTAVFQAEQAAEEIANCKSQIANRELEEPSGANAKSLSPPRRRVSALLAAAAAIVFGGVVILIKNEKGETVARLESDKPIAVSGLAPGHTATIENKAEATGGEIPVARNPSPVATDNRRRATDQPPTPNSQPLPPLSAMSLVTAPAQIPGAKSWTLETLDHRGEIHRMEFSPEGTLLATYGEDGAVRLWNSETGELERMFIGADSLPAASPGRPMARRSPWRPVTRSKPGRPPAAKTASRSR